MDMILFVKQKRLERRVTALESGSGGGNTGDNAMTVEFSSYGEYSTYDFDEHDYSLVSVNLPTFQQLRNSYMDVLFDGDETPIRFNISWADGEGYDRWEAWYYMDGTEDNPQKFVYIMPEFSEMPPPGVYVAMDYIMDAYQSRYESYASIAEATIYFPEV